MLAGVIGSSISISCAQKRLAIVVVLALPRPAEGQVAVASAVAKPGRDGRVGIQLERERGRRIWSGAPSVIGDGVAEPRRQSSCAMRLADSACAALPHRVPARHAQAL
ncbi:hypothetical protein WR25_24100 [Diploscapter pachys]|uniref:Uncharacterized protein n=1 Tax=Diploscapter pachys TaxID=2018661 RepID=A0A2A2K602_9BILA|nr:hypothetical protein WR25_24100 [Diploscapter pachys]